MHKFPYNGEPSSAAELSVNNVKCDLLSPPNDGPDDLRGGEDKAERFAGAHVYPWPLERYACL
jgi:hypothetical protein